LYKNIVLNDFKSREKMFDQNYNVITHTAFVNQKNCINIKFELDLKYLNLKVYQLLIANFIFYLVTKILYSYE